MENLVILGLVALVAVSGLFITSDSLTGAPTYDNPCLESGVLGHPVIGKAALQQQVRSGKYCFTTAGFSDHYCCM